MSVAQAFGDHVVGEVENEHDLVPNHAVLAWDRDGYDPPERSQLPSGQRWGQRPRQMLPQRLPPRLDRPHQLLEPRIGSEAGQEGVARRENRVIDEAERNRRSEPPYGLVVASDERVAIRQEQG